MDTKEYIVKATLLEWQEALAVLDAECKRRDALQQEALNATNTPFPTWPNERELRGARNLIKRTVERNS